MPSSTTTTLSQPALSPYTEAQDPKLSRRQSSTTASPHNDNATPAKGQAVTFGLELEFNIAFTEQTVVNILDDHNINYIHIQKEHSDSDHSALLNAEDYSKECRARYPSWGVSMPLDAQDPYANPTLMSTYITACKQTGQPLRIRNYVSEPLLLAQDLLQQHDLQAEIRAVIRNLGADQPDVRLPDSASSGDYLLCRSADYSKWTLTNDHTLIGSLKSQLMQQLPSKVTASKVADWDSHGIELISPVFNLDQKDQAMADLSSRLATLSSPSVDIVPSIWAGLHVHIGFNAPKPSDLSLKTLQHLAYILLVHEDLITSLFPQHCSGLAAPTPKLEEPEDPFAGMSEEEFDKFLTDEQAAQHAAEKRSGSESSADSGFTTSSTSSSSTTITNIDVARSDSEKDAENETQVLAAEQTFTNHQNKLSNARYHCSLLSGPHPAPPRAIADTIYSTTSIPELIHLLQKPKKHKEPEGEVYRGYMYNFSNILDFYLHGTGRPTVEFSQHECCIDAEKVGRWVGFIEGVVKKAEELAVEPQTYSCMFLNQEVEEFCRWINLDVDNIEYWMERRHTFSKGKDV